MKRVTFSSKRPSTMPASTADEWVEDRAAINQRADEAAYHRRAD